MENVKKLLDAVKHHEGIESDYALAKVLEVRKQRTSDYYKGIARPNAYVCLRIAEILEIPLGEVIAAIELDEETDEKRRLVWERYYKGIGRIAA